MNNQTANDVPTLETWVVQGTNWITQVTLDEFNSQFSSIRQAEEAATRAIEQFQGQEKGLTFILENGEEVLELGGVTLVYLLGTDSDKGFLLFVHELLANAGYYKKSYSVEQLTQAALDKNLEGLKKAEQEQIEAKKSTPKKTRKPKAKTPKKPRKKST